MADEQSPSSSLKRRTINISPPENPDPSLQQTSINVSPKKPKCSSFQEPELVGVQSEENNGDFERIEELGLSSKNDNFSGSRLVHGEVESLGFDDENNKNASFEEKNQSFDAKIEGNEVSVRKNDALTCSLKIELIDGTAVIDVSKNECDGKRNRRKGRKGYNSNNSAPGRKFVYSMKDMEGLRFVDVKGQKKFWQQVYDGLDTTVRKEYDDLGSFRYQRDGNGHRADVTRDYYGRSVLENMSCDAEITGSLDFTCDMDNSGKDGDDLVGECCEYDDTDDEYDSIRRPAFLVEGEPDFESGSPEDGLEYLRRVRWEAAQIPKVKVVKVDSGKLNKEQSVYMPKIPDIEKCPPHLVPLKQWEDEFIADFSELRLGLSYLEDTNDTMSTNPQSLIFGQVEPKNRSSENVASVELQSGGPKLSAVLAMDPLTRVTMLKKRISLFDSATNLSKDECAWLFALCAVVDTPLDADTCASLRCLLRRCAKLRARKSELDDEVAMLNVLATISGKFFGQLGN